MKQLVALFALVLAASVSAQTSVGCWSSNEFGGNLVCGTSTEYHAATAEEIRQDQEYYKWKYGSYDKWGDQMLAHFEESLVGVDPVVAARIRSSWSNVEAKTQEKVAVYVEASQTQVKPTETQPVPKK